jgi:hypothetical protein
MRECRHDPGLKLAGILRLRRLDRGGWLTLI